MPQPIVPIKFQESSEGLYSQQFGGDRALSALQAGLLGAAEPPAVKEAARRLPDAMLAHLDCIYKHEDDALSRFNTTVLAKSGAESRVYGVPATVGDNALLQLKAAGLLTGQGRKVSFTERGRRALADKWMNSTNALSTGKEYVHPDRVAADAAASVRTASTLAERERVIEGALGEPKKRFAR